MFEYIAIERLTSLTRTTNDADAVVFTYRYSLIAVVNTKSTKVDYC